MPRHDDPRTPLLAILRHLESDAKRDEFAALAGTSTGYLYQIASCRTGACRSRLAKRIADASVKMAKKYGCTAVSMEQLATMCPVVEKA